MSSTEGTGQSEDLDGLLARLELAIEHFQDALAANAFPDAYERANETQKIREEIRTRFGAAGLEALAEPRWVVRQLAPDPWSLRAGAPPRPPGDPGLAEALRLAREALAEARELRDRQKQDERARAVRSETLAVAQQSQLGRCPWCSKLVVGPRQPRVGETRNEEGEDGVEVEGQRWHRRCRERAGDLV